MRKTRTIATNDGKGIGNMRRRVVISGMGLINPMGHDVETVWTGLKEAQSGVALTTIFDASSFPTKISAEVKDWDIADTGEDPELWRNRGRHTKFAAGAAKQAVEGSGILDSGIAPTRLGVYLGSGEGNQDFMSFTRMMMAALADQELNVAEFIRAGLESLSPMAEMEQEPSLPAGHVASMFNAQGPNVNCLTACAASSQALGEATEIIRRGDADAMIAGGTHSMIHPFGVTGFNLLTALSTRNDEPERASRPFDRCSARVRGWSCWKIWSTPDAAEHRSMARFSATDRQPTLTGSRISIPQVGVPSVAWSSHSRMRS